MERSVLIGLFAALTTINSTFAHPLHRSGPLDGAWRFEYSCAGATGMYADRCAAGERDIFALSIAQSGDRFCGSYEATAQMGNHVDDGDLNDWTFTPTAHRAFRVHFHLSGTVGDAVVRVYGNRLYWTTLAKQKHDEGHPLTWSFSPPDAAILTRQTTHHMAACAG